MIRGEGVREHMNGWEIAVDALPTSTGEHGWIAEIGLYRDGTVSHALDYKVGGSSWREATLRGMEYARQRLNDYLRHGVPLEADQGSTHSVLGRRGDA